METTPISLNRDAYQLLRQHRRTGQRFSDTLKRLHGRGRPLASFAGAWRPLPGARRRALVAERRRLRALDEERFERLLRGSD